MATASRPSPSPSASPGSPPTPERLFQLVWGFGPTQVLASAVTIGLFDAIAAGRRDAAAIAGACDSSARGVRMLLDALVALGVLTREGAGAAARHGLAPDTEAFLVKGRPSYLGDLVRFQAGHGAKHWLRLTECVRSGTPVVALDQPAEGVPVWHQLVDALFPLGFAAARQVGEELARLYPGRPVRLLDVAAGSGVWGIGAALANLNVSATAFDLPETLEHARAWASRMKVEDRMAFLAGDLRSTDLGSARWDAAILGQICHSEGAENTRRLLAKVARALVPGGTIVIADFLPDPGRSGPPQPLLFALNMLVLTTDGDTWAFPDFQAWLLEAGFRDARLLPSPSPSPLILATRT